MANGFLTFKYKYLGQRIMNLNKWACGLVQGSTMLALVKGMKFLWCHWSCFLFMTFMMIRIYINWPATALRREREKFCPETSPLTACFKLTTHRNCFLTDLKTTDGERFSQSDRCRTLPLSAAPQTLTLSKLSCMLRKRLNKLPWLPLQSLLNFQC